MKKHFLFVISLFIVFNNINFSQQFVKKWEFSKKLIYVGDIDGDGIGEFAYSNSYSLTSIFYDGINLNVKWTINDKALDDNMYDADADVHPDYNKFPSIDFNGDGKRELFFFVYTDETHYAKKSILLVDVVNNTTLFEFSDPSLIYPKLIAFSDVDSDGILELVFTFSYGDEYKTVAYSTGLSITSMEEIGNNIPNNYKLMQNYPNPFNPSTTIEYEISQPENIKINIYDITGRLVKELVNEQRNTGKYSTIWNGKDNSGNIVASGNYFYQIVSGDFVQAKKMILLK